MFYSFHTSSTTPLVPASLSQAPQPTTLLGPSAALSQLLDKGCTLATKPWVDNHWAMILWKLAGMVCLDPERESDGREKRWCWGEVMRQLLYRYEVFTSAST
jgi:breast cancer 2 susceptibility protein